ncbi:hypothetical protein RF11_08956 [Thelohanellus kitauei]|uniref:Tc1-like transposase DDE domain-containing protein n=1 Tax=Thelohanellus kitauei TaxID=669202 RepID=A0A0C2M6X2_THEKT|nr:hypothetical protein RF11_08956 [Thelohanellus kitauei]
MDIRFHKTNRVKTMLQENCRVVIYLPPYSPFLNPIENLFSKRKKIVQRASPRSETDLFNLIESSSIEITPSGNDGYNQNMLKHNRRWCCLRDKKIMNRSKICEGLDLESDGLDRETLYMCHICPHQPQM